MLIYWKTSELKGTVSTALPYSNLKIQMSSNARIVRKLNTHRELFAMPGIGNHLFSGEILAELFFKVKISWYMVLTTESLLGPSKCRVTIITGVKQGRIVFCLMI